MAHYTHEYTQPLIKDSSPVVEGEVIETKLLSRAMHYFGFDTRNGEIPEVQDFILQKIEWYFEPYQLKSEPTALLIDGINSDPMIVTHITVKGWFRLLEAPEVIQSQNTGGDLSSQTTT